MQLEKYKIDAHNQSVLVDHKRRYEFIAESIPGVESILEKLVAFQVAIPSWALGTGGTRFGRFSGGGEPRSLEEKIEDVGLLHSLNQSSGAISLHIPWDIPKNAGAIKTLAAQHGLRFDAVNSNTFQDQPDQKLSYKFGSLQHTDKAVRQQAIQHNIEVIKHGIELGSDAITVWLSDGSCFPGQLNFRKAFQRTLDGLKEIYAALPDNWKMFVEYKAYEPNFYSMAVGDWGQSLLYATKLGPKAYTLVDLGHHLPNANIEQIVGLLLGEGKLGGFHFNDSKYGDDDLTVGSINPYQLFLIFNELVEGMDARGMQHHSDLGWMIDASHNVKDPLEDLLQSVEAIKIAYAQALLVDTKALAAAQESNDVAKAQEILQQAYRTDVRPVVAEARLRAKGALQPMQLFREMKVRENLIKERGQKTVATGLELKNPKLQTRNTKQTSVIAIFDIGKTNKKLFLFDEQYNVVLEKSEQFEEAKDEDGFPCEDLNRLTSWVQESLRALFAGRSIHLQALNFSTYGASFVHLDAEGKPAAPLYNYLKPYPPELLEQFYNRYGGEITFSMHTASPVLGSLNSGMQLYRIRHENPELFKRIRYALHLPQYMSYLVTGRPYSDITSIGCHTGLWNFPQNHYHEWLYREGISDKLAPIFPSDQLMFSQWENHALLTGVGLHDSSAALIPYLVHFNEPFLLISTGTWCISLNPFNQSRLTVDELKQDCLCYMEYRGKPVKASRLFAGYEHEHQVKRLASHFNVDPDYYKNITFDPALVAGLSAGKGRAAGMVSKTAMVQESQFGARSLSAFDNYETAYHQLMLDLMAQQVTSSKLVLNNCPVKRIFVDGGFSRNPIYMHLLACAFPEHEIYAATVAQASALGAALAVHSSWNKKNASSELVELKLYTATPAINLV